MRSTWWENVEAYRNVLILNYFGSLRIRKCPTV